MTDHENRPEHPRDMQRIEWVPLDDLLAKRHRDNPKRHDMPKLRAMIRRFGFVQPPTLDATSDILVAGHGRLRALSELRESGQRVPKRIQVGPKGEWMVPVLCGVAFSDDDERDAYLLVDNFASEAGGWDPEKLTAMLRKQGDDRLTSLGIDEKKWSRLVTRMRAPKRDRAVSAGLKFKLVVTCEGEDQQAELMEELEARGLDVKPIMS